MDQQYFTIERRKENMEKVAAQLQQLQGIDFNQLVFTLTDLIQTSFLDALLMGKSSEERKEYNEKVVETTNALIDTLNDHSVNMMIDIVVLTNLIMDAIETATQRAVEDSKH